MFLRAGVLSPKFSNHGVRVVQKKNQGLTSLAAPILCHWTIFMLVFHEVDHLAPFLASLSSLVLLIVHSLLFADVRRQGLSSRPSRNM